LRRLADGAADRHAPGAGPVSLVRGHRHRLAALLDRDLGKRDRRIGFDRGRKRRRPADIFLWRTDRDGRTRFATREKPPNGAADDHEQDRGQNDELQKPHPLMILIASPFTEDQKKEVHLILPTSFLL
jgi:hypothetical protein